jgi:hypothetical protein
MSWLTSLSLGEGRSAGSCGEEVSEEEPQVQTLCKQHQVSSTIDYSVGMWINLSRFGYPRFKILYILHCFAAENHVCRYFCAIWEYKPVVLVLFLYLQYISTETARECCRQRQ